MTAEPDRASPLFWDARYRAGPAPWDQGSVAPEVLALAASRPGGGGWALDIGCGSGAHSRELARCGYRVIGIDLSWVALQRAQTTANAEQLPWWGVQGSARDLLIFARTFAVALDVGCLHGLPAAVQQEYAAALFRLLQPGGYYLLYAVHPAETVENGLPGIAPVQIEALLAPGLRCVQRQQGWQEDRRADWWLWQKAI